MKKIYYFFYRYLGMKLPALGRLSFGSQKFRNYLVSNFIDNAGKRISINRNVILDYNIKIGHDTGISANCLIQGPTNIGDYVIIGPETYIYTTNHKFSDINMPIRYQGNSENKEVVIENDVWIGSRVTILPGVRIGEGSVIGAASVVTRDVEPYTVVAGNPARKIRNRKNET